MDDRDELQVRATTTGAGGAASRRMFARIRDPHGEPILQRITRLPHMRALSSIPNCWLSRQIAQIVR